MKTARTMIAALIATLAAAPAAHAATLVSDPFTDGAVTDGADPLDLAWGSAVAVTPSVAVDATIGSGNAFVFNSTGTFSRILAPIDPIQLTPTRDKIRIEFDLHPTVLLNTTGGIRFGIRDSTANAGVFDSYSGNYGTGTDATVALLADHNGTFGGATQESLNPQDVDGTANLDTNASTLSDTALHRAKLTVQYTEAGRVDLRSRIDTRVAAAAHTGSLNTFFDQVGFSIGGNANQDFNFDNYRITRWVNRLDDTFDSASATTGDDANDPNDTAWFRTVSTSNTLTVANDDASIGSNNAMSVDNSSSFRRILANFEEVDLGSFATTIYAAFDVRRVSTSANSSTGFRFGLYNANGTVVTADNQDSTTHNDTGYFVSLGVGDAGGQLYRDTGGDALLGGSPFGTSIFTNNNLDLFDGTTPHFIEMYIRRIIGGVQIELLVDSVSVMLVNDTNPAFLSSFSEIVFGTGGITFDYVLDNVVVEYMVPAPAALPAGLALIALAAARRTRRRHR